MNTNITQNKRRITAIVFLFVMHTVGVITFLHPRTNALFYNLVPFHLLICTVVLSLFHAPYNTKGMVVFALAFAISWTVETIGVHTGTLFGSYHYTPVLGWQIADTPLLIGLNWLTLTYSLWALLGKYQINVIFKLFLGAACMTIFDYLMEPAAVTLNMWQWTDNVIPLRNYAMWFALSFGIFVLYHLQKVRYQNSIALWFLIVQILFFSAIRLFSATQSVNNILQF